MARRMGSIPLGLALLAAVSGTAAGGGLDFDLVGARAIGRAGATTVSGDDGTALVVNPGGLARSTSLRVQLELAVHDDDASFRAPDAAAPDSPTIADRSTPVLAPGVAVHGALGPVVLGAALLELGYLDRVLPAPQFGEADSEQGEMEVARLFPHRYGGLELTYRHRLAVVGAATRVGEWLGLGVSLGAADVEVSERRRIWAGFAGRDRLASPTRDLDLALAGRDRLVPFAAAGLLVAPPPLPLELAVAASWSADAFLDGTVTLSSTSIERYPEPLVGDGAPEATMRLAMPTTLRAGLRYLGDRFLVEVGAELTWLRAAGAIPAWDTSGVAVGDETGAIGTIEQVPSLLAQRDHGAVRAAVDVEIVPGLFWVTAGYAYTSGGTGRSHLSPGFGDLAGHTVSLGVEGTWNQIAFALGIARQFAASVTVAAGDSDVEMENPFGADAGTASAGAGRHGHGHDAVGLTVEVAWE